MDLKTKHCVLILILYLTINRIVFWGLTGRTKTLITLFLRLKLENVNFFLWISIICFFYYSRSFFLYFQHVWIIVVLLWCNTRREFIFWFYQIILSTTTSCIVGIVSIFQEEHKTMREFKNDLFCRCCLNQCTMDDIKSFCMSDWWTWRIKRSTHAKTTQNFWLECIQNSSKVNSISNFFLLCSTDKTYISLLFLM